MSDRPSDLRYTTTHEWVRVEGEEATVGITDFAVEHLGDLVFVDLPDAGQQLAAGETAAEVESVKAVGEVYAPVTGTVVAVNEGLRDDQGPLSTDPFGTGWLFRIKLAGAPPDSLMDLATYERHLEEEAG
jgi:glycine cleavage system H protein